MPKTVQAQNSKAAFAQAVAVAFCLLLWGGAGTFARGATLTATVDRDTVSVGESVTLSLTFEGGGPPGNPGLPQLPGFRVTPGTSQRTEMTFINGQQSMKRIFDYSLVPTQVGQLTIPPLQVAVGNETLTTQPVKITVVQGQGGAGAAGGAGSQNQPAFLKLIVPKTNVYVGEPLAVEMHLYWQDAQNIQMPQLKAEGFTLGKQAEPRQTQTTVGGVGYNLAVFRTAVAAAKTGIVTLGPGETSLNLRVPTQRRGRDPFDPFGFFGSRVELRPLVLKSETVALQVSPLPPGAPETFNGAVGSFGLRVSASPVDVSVGDPITVSIQISGQGLIESLALPPQPRWTNSFSAYPPTSTVTLNDALGLSGTKVFTNVIVPLNHEIKVLPPFQFAYFDPNGKSYRTLSGPAVPLTVKPSATVATVLPVSTNALSPREDTPPATDILHIQARPETLTPAPTPLVRQAWFLSLQGVPLLAWAALLIRRKSGESLANNPRLRRQREVARRVRVGLQSLRTAAAANQSDEFFATLFRVLQEQLGERLDVPASAITEAVIDERLRPRGLIEETLRELHELFQLCNLARYAPIKGSQELTAVIPRVEGVLGELQQMKG